MVQEISGSQALAMGAIKAGVQFVTGYPGSPSTSVVDALLQLASDELRIEWAINEKSAFDAALGCRWPESDPSSASRASDSM